MRFGHVAVYIEIDRARWKGERTPFHLFSNKHLASQSGPVITKPIDCTTKSLTLVRDRVPYRADRLPFQTAPVVSQMYPCPL